MSSEEKSKPPTPQQRTAIEHVSGPMLVIAGAGSGKTTVLTERIVCLLESGAARADEILAVTFTKNAAQEIERRVRKRLPHLDTSELRARTFHAYCAEVLGRMGRMSTVVEDIDLRVYLRRHVSELPLKIFTKAARPDAFIAELIEFNSRCQDELVGAGDLSAYVRRLEADATLPMMRVTKSGEVETFTRVELLARCKEIAAVYAHVTEAMRAKGWTTYGHLIQATVHALRESATELAAERQRCRFILIDEFQDSNHAQMELADLLAGREKNVFVVGDPDQAIYRFRGATSEAFEDFKRRYPGCRMVSLDDNFRSTQAILTCAHAVINANPATEIVTDDGRRMEREVLRAANQAPGARPVSVLLYSGHEAEAQAVVAEMEALQQSSGADWKHFAVLYGKHSHRDAVLAELEARKIPVDVVGVDLFDDSAVRDLLAAAQAVMNTDDSVALFRTAALPCFAIDPGQLQKAMAAAGKGVPLVSTLKSVPGGLAVLAAIGSAKKEVADKDAAAALDAIQRRFEVAATNATAVLQKFAADWPQKAICEDPTLTGWLEYVDLYREAGGRLCAEERAADGGVKLMTIFGAKGLEFRHVWVIRCGSNSLPTAYREPLFEFPRALSKSVVPSELDAKTEHEQEQRRVFYVGMTRAKESLTLCARIFSKKTTMPSSYCKELLENDALRPILQKRIAPAATLRIEANAVTLPIESWVLANANKAPESMRLSASAIESFQACGLRFKLERLWRIPGDTPAHMLYGNAMHLAMKTYYEGVKRGRTPELAIVLAGFADTMEEAAIQDEHQRGLFLAQGRKQLEAFYAARQEAPPPEVLAVEEWLEFQHQGVKVVGRIDRVDRVEGGVHIADYKTGNPKDQEKADKSLQLGVYALAAERHGHKVVSLSFHNLENDTVVTTTRTRAELLKVEDTIAEVAQKIRAGEFEPAKSAFTCGGCAYRSICPEHEQKTYTIAKAVATVQ
jgi:DNA helicase-2/ATP-dependent DNA helicase PcrA